MDSTLLDIITKNPFSFGTFIAVIAAAIVSIYRYFVAQGDKKDIIISKKDDSLSEIYKELVSQKIDPIVPALKNMSEDIRRNTEETSELNKLISNLIILQEHKKL